MNTMKKLMLTAIIVATPLFAFDLGNVIGKVVNEVSNEIKKIPNIQNNNYEEKTEKKNYESNSEKENNSSKNYEKQEYSTTSSYEKISPEEVDLFAYLIFDKYKSNLNKDTLTDWYLYLHSRRHYEKIKNDEFRYRDEMSSYRNKFNIETKKAKSYFKNKIFKNDIYVKVDTYDFEKERFPVFLLSKDFFARIKGNILVGEYGKHARLFMINTKKTYLNIPKSEARDYVSSNGFLKRGRDRYIKGIYYYKIKDVSMDKPIYNDTMFINHKHPIPHAVVNAEAIKIELRVPSTNKLLKTITY